jgi:large subunit ribosomal protein L13
MSTNRKTIEIDATGQAPGRLASKIATYLMGKHKVKYTPNIDFGDKVVITNCDKIVFTGKKLDQKLYRHHSNHPGGLKEKQAKTQMAESPEELIRLTVAKMLPKNKLRDQRMIRLHFKKS